MTTPVLQKESLRKNKYLLYSDCNQDIPFRVYSVTIFFLFLSQFNSHWHIKTEYFVWKEAFAVFIFLMLFVLFAVYYDLKTFKIPNKLNAIGIITGILMNSFLLGMRGFISSLAGIVLPILMLFILFSMRVIGAGDVKLFCLTGAFLMVEVWKVIVLAFIFAACFGTLFVLRKLLRGSKHFFTKIHMSIPILMGCVFYKIGAWMWQ